MSAVAGDLPPPESKILPFPNRRDPLPKRWMCPPPCNSTVFTLWTDGKVYCANCYGHHHNIAFEVKGEP
jgi:hypothetical protein